MHDNLHIPRLIVVQVDPDNYDTLQQAIYQRGK
jgi:hypothetical protein